MEIRWYQLLFQIVNFGILIFLLNRFLYRPILKIIEDRNKKIEDSLKAAEATLKEKEKINELKKLAVAEAEKEAVKIVETAKHQADLSGKQILSEAQAEAEAAVNKKMELLTDKLAQEEKRLQGRVADLVITTTRQVLKSSLGKEEQKRIVDRQIKELKNWL
ncbi:ATP synthase F0 subunit B [Candidatus Beckwithbacteria bacterium RIFCSPLOWO2_02_FULL_47_23]|uniref:ATP synthase subunit b n=2 Tax=Candidatus Beckwithiibacteriota TaxID=1752726 RepID=A0A1F5E2B8_9BACT|nr:MAG: ATP synthase F0 subunit B [Candidatus Beckwithbacteria bacterium RIFCSPHIGHO2_12_FULL_47_17]OGD61456.1 MAG: ATP synthase F0 subunit B [Candidatus Beckwithbacteria bacterium RIFCSPLOWO2_02_FULL_47_23]